jgi:hypothetical protein
MDIDIASMWRRMRVNSADTPHAGAQLATTGQGITIDITQECQIALPWGTRVPEVGVTITSNRPGVAAQVTIAANFNSSSGSYQGPTTVVGQGEFTATSSQVLAGFVVLPSGWPILGVGAVAEWADGAPQSATLTYVQLACDPLVWWGWLVRALAIPIRPSSAQIRSIMMPSRSPQ